MYNILYLPCLLIGENLSTCATGQLTLNQAGCTVRTGRTMARLISTSRGTRLRPTLSRITRAPPVPARCRPTRLFSPAPLSRPTATTPLPTASPSFPARAAAPTRAQAARTRAPLATPRVVSTPSSTLLTTSRSGAGLTIMHLPTLTALTLTRRVGASRVPTWARRAATSPSTSRTSTLSSTLTFAVTVLATTLAPALARTRVTMPALPAALPLSATTRLCTRTRTLRSTS